MTTQFQPGDRVSISAENLPKTRFVVMLVKPIQEAYPYGNFRQEFDMASMVFGKELQVMFVGGEDLTFYDSACKMVAGFPIFLTDEGPLGLDGTRLKIEKTSDC